MSSQFFSPRNGFLLHCVLLFHPLTIFPR